MPVDVESAQRIVENTHHSIPDITLETLHWAEREGHIFIEWEMKGTVEGKQVMWRGVNRNLLRGTKSIEAVSYWDRLGLSERVSADPRSAAE